MIDAFWRAAAYCLLPRVIAWSLLPLAIAATLVLLLGWWFWEPAVAEVRATLEQWSLLQAALEWLESIGAAGLRALLAPLIVVALAVPAVVVLSLLLVAWAATPAVVSLVARRRFADLERRHGASWWRGLAWSLLCTLAALAALVLSLPLWLVPPVALVVPPLIWGWLTCRVLAFDTLAAHASVAERRLLLHRHRWALLAMGVMCGYMGAAPALLWAASALTLVFAPLLVLLSVWLYTAVFVFSACWYAHFTLAALQRLRAEMAGEPSAAGSNAQSPLAETADAASAPAAASLPLHPRPDAAPPALPAP